MTYNNPDARKPLILIAEDVESNYKLLEIILKKEYELLWAKNGREAVDYALEHHPDAVLMDIKMPVMDGIEALKEIRRHTTQLPVIMQTAYAFDTDRRIAEEAGCNGFITKPVMPRELKKIAETSLTAVWSFIFCRQDITVCTHTRSMMVCVWHVFIQSCLICSTTG